MSSVAFYTLGCKVNQYDTDAMAELFLERGYEVVDFNSSADIYVLNTCDVTNESARKSRQSIRKAIKNNPNATIVVAGCYAQLQAKRISEISGVDVIVGTKNRNKIVEFVERAKDSGEQVVAVENIMLERDYEEIGTRGHRQRTRAFLKIQEGCNMFCSYCIIPYARGPLRSRPIESILAEVQNLSDDGFKEIVLTGIHLGLYGHDLNEGPRHLEEVITEISKVEGIQRIRLGSIEALELTDGLLQTLSSVDKFCHHFHIPLQSGSDAVLMRMRRRYTTGQFEERIKRIRDIFFDVSITTDIITGFPGESPEEFDETLKFLDAVGFSKLHVFPFSPKVGTPASKMSHQVPNAVKRERSHVLLELSRDFEKRFHEQHIGRIVEVLFENEFKEGEFEGHTENYIKVVAPSLSELSNMVLEVRLKENRQDHMMGTIVQ